MIVANMELMFSNSLFVFIFGLLIGSFLNVVIYRVPRGESIVMNRSHCPSCGYYLKPWDLVPVFSYCLLGGKCRECKAKIRKRYFLVEIITGIVFVYVASRSDWSKVSELLVGFSFIALLIALSFIDLYTMRLPNSLVLTIFLFGAIRVVISANTSILMAALGAGTAAGCFTLIYLFYEKGIGLGDVKLIGALGFFLGFPNIIYAVLLGSLMGSLIGILLFLIRRVELKQPIPFGPFLAAGGLITYTEKCYIELFF